LTDNRRSATRHDVSLAVTLEMEGKTLETEMRNLSLGGANLALAQRIPMGTRLKLRFRVPTHDQPIEVGAQVRWSSEDGAGVQFDGLRAREVWSLNKYFEKL
jgi:c-di-GMP-binding flagellar brake protein YcgR